MFVLSKFKTRKNNFLSRLQSKYHFAADEQSEDSLQRVILSEWVIKANVSMFRDDNADCHGDRMGTFFFI